MFTAFKYTYFIEHLLDDFACDLRKIIKVVIYSGWKIQTRWIIISLNLKILILSMLSR